MRLKLEDKLVFLTIISIVMLALVYPAFAANEWRSGDGSETPTGSDLVNDIDTIVDQEIVQPLERLLIGYREGADLKYNSGSTLDITVGETACANSGETIVKFRRNTSAINATFASNLDTGAEASSTTYYVYAVCDADANTFTIKFSTSSSAPSSSTYFKRLGSFFNNSSSDIEQVANDDEGITVATGTSSNGGTISLPSGWSQDECDWTVSLGNANTSGPKGQSHTDGVTHQATVSASRVASCTWNAINSGDSSQSGGCTPNYIIVCHR